MIENLAYLHYSCLYEQEEGSKVCLEPPSNWIVLPLAFCACLPTQPTEAAPLLQYGDSGKAVVSLQNQLKQAGCLAQDAASDGRYGRLTYAAVEKLQQENDLLIDGITGNQTYAALAENRACNTSGEGLELGDRSKEVKLLQIQLNNWGFPLDGQKLQPTGIFDDPTRNALQEFEEYFGLRQDGILDVQNSQILWTFKEDLTAKGKALLRDDDKDFDEYKKAIRAIGSSAVPYLTPLLKSQDRDKAVEALGYLGAEAKNAVPALITYLKSQNWGSARSTNLVSALSSIGAEAKDVVVRNLVPLLESPNQDDRFVAATALGDIGANAQDAVPSLIPLLTDYRKPTDAVSEFNDDANNVSSVGMEALAKIGPNARAAIPALTKQLSQDNGLIAAVTLVSIDPSATSKLLKALDSNEKKTRFSAAFVISLMESVDQELVNKLLRIVEDKSEDIEVRQKAGVSLLLLKQDVRQFFEENNPSLYEEWLKCPRRESEVQSIRVFYFDPTTNTCESPGRGGGARGWWEFFIGRGK